MREGRTDGLFASHRPCRSGAAGQLVGAVQYADSLIDPKGGGRITDTAAAATFLRKVDRRPSSRDTWQIIELREAARRFS